MHEVVFPHRYVCTHMRISGLSDMGQGGVTTAAPTPQRRTSPYGKHLRGAVGKYGRQDKSTYPPPLLWGECSRIFYTGRYMCTAEETEGEEEKTDWKVIILGAAPSYRQSPRRLPLKPRLGWGTSCSHLNTYFEVVMERYRRYPTWACLECFASSKAVSSFLEDNLQRSPS